jgi:hypothetical protein
MNFRYSPLDFIVIPLFLLAMLWIFTRGKSKHSKPEPRDYEEPT